MKYGSSLNIRTCIKVKVHPKKLRLAKKSSLCCILLTGQATTARLDQFCNRAGSRRAQAAGQGWGQNSKFQFLSEDMQVCLTIMRACQLDRGLMIFFLEFIFNSLHHNSCLTYVKDLCCCLLGVQVTRQTVLNQLQVEVAQVSQGSPCQKALETNASLRWWCYLPVGFKVLARPLTSDVKIVY